VRNDDRESFLPRDINKIVIVKSHFLLLVFDVVVAFHIKLSFIYFFFTQRNTVKKAKRKEEKKYIRKLRNRKNFRSRLTTRLGLKRVMIIIIITFDF